MATNQFGRQGSTPPTPSGQKYFVVCAPPPIANKKLRAIRRYLRKQFWRALSLVIIGVSLFAFWWMWETLREAGTVIYWWCEILAGGLSLLTLWLYHTFQGWGRERRRPATRPQKKSEEITPWLCTPPPLLDTDNIVYLPQEELAVTIEHWITHQPVALSEAEATQTTLTDEIIAPDALVINIEVDKAA